jgi:hypothetical protein
MSGRGVVRREVIEDHGQIMLHFLLVCGDSSRPGSPFPRPRHRITTYDTRPFCQCSSAAAPGAGGLRLRGCLLSPKPK